MFVSIRLHGNKGYISKAYYLYHKNEEYINKMLQVVFIRQLVLYLWTGFHLLQFLNILPTHWPFTCQNNFITTCVYVI